MSDQKTVTFEVAVAVDANGCVMAEGWDGGAFKDKVEAVRDMLADHPNRSGRARVEIHRATLTVPVPGEVASEIKPDSVEPAR